MVLYRLYSPPTAVGDVRGGAARSLRNYLNAHSPKSEEDSWAHRKFMMYRRLRPTCGVPAVAQGPLPQGRSSRVCYPHLSVSRPTTAGRCQRSPFPSLSLFIHSFMFFFNSQPNPILFSQDFEPDPLLLRTCTPACTDVRTCTESGWLERSQSTWVDGCPTQQCAEFIHESYQCVEYTCIHSFVFIIYVCIDKVHLLSRTCCKREHHAHV